MSRFLLRRTAHAAFSMLLVVILAFLLIRAAPGDPFSASLENPGVSAEYRAAWRERHCLDCPLHVQFARYAGGVIRGDLGFSVSTGQPVIRAIGNALPRTLLLMATGLALAFAFGVAAGVAQALRRGDRVDRTLSTVSLFFYSMPDFWLASMALLIFARWLPLFPIGGVADPVMHRFMSPIGQVLDTAHHLVLPALTLALLTAALIARHQRSATLEVLGKDFVRTALAKGATRRRVTLVHVMRNSLLPTITLAGLLLPALLGGAVFIERVFTWPGMGMLAVSAIEGRDYWLVLGVVIVAGAMVTLGSLMADLLTARADPRLRDSVAE